MTLLKECQSTIGELRMNIKISNVAKVFEANISIKGISVISGLNDTGKSTILKAIYMCLNSFKNFPDKVLAERKKSISTIMRHMEPHFDEEGYTMLPQSLLKEVSYVINQNIVNFIDNPDNYEYFKELFLSSLVSYKEFLEENKTIYSDEFIKPIYEKIKDVFVKPDEIYVKYISEMYLRNTFSNQFNSEQNKLEGSIEIIKGHSQYYILINENKIKDISFDLLRGPDAIYIPTYNMLDYINNRRFHTNSYSPESDVRKYIMKIGRQEQSMEDYMEIEDNINSIKEILGEVVHGKLINTPSGELRYLDADMDSLFSMENVASGMKLFLLIQSLVESGRIKRDSVLLIDEPETNLHPEWHLIFAEILVLMYKYMGVISVVNSHSPYFIRALEVKMADHEIGDMATYYLMEENEKNSYIAKDVTGETNKIYEKLYKPLEYL